MHREKFNVKVTKEPVVVWKMSLKIDKTDIL